MNKLVIIAAIALNIDTANANLMECEVGSTLVTNCTLKQTNVAKPIESDTFGIYETDYTIKFVFDCPGERPVLGFRAGTDKSHFAIVSKPQLQSATITGKSSLAAFDPDPTRTKELTFHRKCSLEVKSVDKSPSTSEMLSWREDAFLQHKILRLAYNSYLIITNMEAVNQWDKAQISAVSDAISAILDDRILKHGVVIEAAKPKEVFVSPKQYRKNVSSLNPEMGNAELEQHVANYHSFLGGDTLDLITLQYFTESIVENRPVGTKPTLGEAVKAAKNASSLREKARKELIHEHQLAIAMIDRAKKYKVEILKELEKLSNAIDTGL